jgi:hypothetical protein
MSLPQSHTPPTRGITVFTGAAFLAAFLVGLLGLLPHLRWSLELHQLAWFYNSYDEGLYGWLSITGFTPNRGLSDLIMHGLYLAAGSNSQLAMILADFFLPFGVTLAACYMVRPLFVSPGPMVAGSLFVIISAECLALRSTFIPHSFLYTFLHEEILPRTGGPAGIFQLNSQTSTFWLFRTPEPQASWMLMFFVLGVAMRSILRTSANPPKWGMFVAATTLAGASYLFCAFSLGGAFLLFAAFSAKSHPRSALVVGVGGLLCIMVCMGLSLVAATQIGGHAFVFPSSRPVVMLSAFVGLVSAAIVLVKTRGPKPLSAIHLFSIALGLTPLVMANQQLVTGRMIFLFEFEDFGLAQISALALLIAVFYCSELSSGSARAGSNYGKWRWIGPHVAWVLWGWIIFHSQQLGYSQYLSENRLARSYERTLESLPNQGELIACADFFQTDILALLLGRRPAYLISRDMAFTAPISRLKNAKDAPEGETKPKLALFTYLALTGTTPSEFSQRFSAITNPTNPNWQDRFMLGGLLYNLVDVWAPLTHGRDTKLAWIATQEATIVNEYEQFLLAGKIVTQPTILIMRQDQLEPEFLVKHHARRLAIDKISAPIPMKAYRLEASEIR